MNGRTLSSLSQTPLRKIVGVDEGLDEERLECGHGVPLYPSRGNAKKRRCRQCRDESLPLAQRLSEKAHEYGISAGFMESVLVGYTDEDVVECVDAARFVSDDEHMILYWMRDGFERHQSIRKEDLPRLFRLIGLLLSERVAVGAALALASEKNEEPPSHPDQHLHDADLEQRRNA